MINVIFNRVMNLGLNKLAHISYLFKPINIVYCRHSNKALQNVYKATKEIQRKIL